MNNNRYIKIENNSNSYYSNGEKLGKISDEDIKNYVDTEMVILINGCYKDINDYLGDDECANIRLNNHPGF